MPGKGVLKTPGCENQQGIHPDEREDAGVPGTPLKGPTYGLTHQWTHLLLAPALGQQLESEKRARDVQGGTTLSGLRVGAGEGAFHHFVPLLSPLLTQPADRHYYSFSELSPNPAYWLRWVPSLSLHQTHSIW